MRKPAKTSAKKRLPKSRPERATAASPSQPRAAEPTPGEKNGPVSKQARVIAMLRSRSGATIAAMTQETGWQQHSVRGFLAGVVRKKLKLKLQSGKVDGHRIYRIESEGSSKAGDRQSKRRSA